MIIILLLYSIIKKLKDFISGKITFLMLCNEINYFLKNNLFSLIFSIILTKISPILGFIKKFEKTYSFLYDPFNFFKKSK